jgi:hypothetical protein
MLNVEPQVDEVTIVQSQADYLKKPVNFWATVEVGLSKGQLGFGPQGEPPLQRSKII